MAIKSCLQTTLQAVNHIYGSSALAQLATTLSCKGRATVKQSDHYATARYLLPQTLQVHNSDWVMLLQVYELPNLHLEGKMCRTNLVPRTIVRGPGFLNAVMIMEQVPLILAHTHKPAACLCQFTTAQPRDANCIKILPIIHWIDSVIMTPTRYSLTACSCSYSAVTCVAVTPISRGLSAVLGVQISVH